jgi:hypothetical protein
MIGLHKEFGSSGQEFRTMEKAEEEAAKAMIRTLEMNYGLETKDISWLDKRRFIVGGGV